MTRNACLLTAVLLLASGLFLTAEAQRAPARSRSASSARSTPAPTSRTPGGTTSGTYSRSGYGSYGSRRYGSIYPSRSRYWQPSSLRGRVVLPGGGASVKPPRIYASCPGRIIPLTYCDLRGNFSIGWDRFSQFGFHRVGTGYGSRLTGFQGCGLMAFLPGYSSPLVGLNSWTGLTTPSVGKINLRQQPGVEGQTVSFTTLAAPKPAKKAYKKGLKHFRNDRLKKAEEQFQKAVEEYPEYAAAWAMLADVRLALGYESGVREALKTALEIDPNYLKPNILLARIEVKDKNWLRVIELTKTALRLNPNLTELRYYQALALYSTDQLEEALRTARFALVDGRASEFPQPQLRGIIGSVYAANKEYDRAATYYRQVIAHWPNSKLARTFQSELEQWEATGKIDGTQPTVADETSSIVERPE